MAKEFLHLAVNRRLISKFGRWISQICLVVVIPKLSWQIASWYLYDHTTENLHTQQWPFPELHLDQRVGGEAMFPFFVNVGDHHSHRKFIILSCFKRFMHSMLHLESKHLCHLYFSGYPKYWETNNIGSLHASCSTSWDLMFPQMNCYQLTGATRKFGT